MEKDVGEMIMNKIEKEREAGIEREVIHEKLILRVKQEIEDAIKKQVEKGDFINVETERSFRFDADVIRFYSKIQILNKVYFRLDLQALEKEQGINDLKKQALGQLFKYNDRFIK